MRTVKSLIEELSKFRDDALCYAYEGEVTGIVINDPDRKRGRQGTIYCRERDEEEPETETNGLER